MPRHIFNLLASAGSSNCFKTARNNDYKIYTGASLLLSLGHADSRGTNKELQTKG